MIIGFLIMTALLSVHSESAGCCTLALRVHFYKEQFLMTRTETVLETLAHSPLNHLMRLLALESLQNSSALSALLYKLIYIS